VLHLPDFKYPTVSLQQQSLLVDSWVSAALSLSNSAGLVTLSYSEVLRMSLSDLSDIFDSQGFKQLQKAKEAENQLLIAPLERLNEVIRGLNNLGKALSHR
jgi:hypothetical protein